jgi:hypothetical protein
VTYVRPRIRKTKAQQVTWCTDCERWVGVMPGAPSTRSYNRKEPRVTRHYLRNTMQICKRSGFTLPDALIFDREVS